MTHFQILTQCLLTAEGVYIIQKLILSVMAQSVISLLFATTSPNLDVPFHPLHKLKKETTGVQICTILSRVFHYYCVVGVTSKPAATVDTTF